MSHTDTTERDAKETLERARETIERSREMTRAFDDSDPAAIRRVIQAQPPHIREEFDRQFRAMEEEATRDAATRTPVRSVRVKPTRSMV